jgi:hypothetical protein
MLLKPWHVSVIQSHVQGMYHIKGNVRIHI